MSNDTVPETNDRKTSQKETKTCEDTNEQADTHTDVTDIADLLCHAGEFGRYQVLLFISTMPFYFSGVVVYFAQMFMTEASPQHWCWVPELANLSVLERRALAIPGDEHSRYGYAQCSAFIANWSHVLLTGQTPAADWPTAPCQHGWEFNTSDIPYPTVSSEWGWVCDKDSYQASAQSIFFSGSVVGCFLFGWLADKYGRLPVIVLSNLVGCAGGVLTVFARNFTEFAAYRFFTGLAYDNCMMMTYLLVLEYIAPRYRTVVTNSASGIFYSLAAVSIPWVALACGHWKTFALVTSLPLALAIFSPFVFLESPRWLLSKGRVDQAVENLQKIGKSNKKTIPPKLIEKFKKTALKKSVEEDASVLELIKRPLLRRIFILMSLEFMCCSIVFDSLVRSVNQLEFDFFLSFSLVSFTEFPALLTVAFVMDFLGRKWMTSIMMLAAFLFCIMTVFVGEGLPSVICAMMARFAVNMSYTGAAQWAAEVFPTPVRGSGIAIVHIFGNVATIISPYIVYLENVRVWLPLVVAGCVAGLGALVALVLPETAGKDMSQTFDDAENLVINQRFWNMPCMTKDRKTGHDNHSFEP